jgi:hypothetical protein
MILNTKMHSVAQLGCREHQVAAYHSHPNCRAHHPSSNIFSQPPAAVATHRIVTTAAAAAAARGAHRLLTYYYIYYPLPPVAFVE